ncbi:LabA-like NYN domain-containing protein [Microbulbifer hainanensis]|uniref:LabA-like NYN domain-containing protein n=1 Tax=Microbulbifer hainanensis TaxID=2735675 RepID=UPI0029C0BAA8|nr:NYN domain-containing protein [Microbulbifer hainanensis]
MLNRVAILVDVQNIYYTTRQVYGRNFDYNAFWTQVAHDRQVSRAIAYAIDRGDEKQRQFQNILRAIGFEVKLKPYIQRADGSAKGDWDVGITIDALECAPEVDVLVLVSGDGDFDMLVERIRAKYGIAVEVYGVADLAALSLKRAASRFFPIDQALLMKNGGGNT